MPISACPPSSTSLAFEQLNQMIPSLVRAWSDEAEQATLRCTLRDVQHHVCAALSALDLSHIAPALRIPHRAFACLAADVQVLVREAYLSVLALGQLLRRAREDALAEPAGIQAGELAVWCLLEELSPYVSRADGALRRVLLDDESLDDAVQWIAAGSA